MTLCPRQISTAFSLPTRVRKRPRQLSSWCAMPSNKRNIIVMQGSFHGRTATMHGHDHVQVHLQRKLSTLAQWHFFHHPSRTRINTAGTKRQQSTFACKNCSALVATKTSPGETAALFFEPVLGEGGYVPAPPRFLQEVRDFCTQHDILLVVDEIQTGMGRTGEWLAMQHSAIEPDVLLMAKGLGSGMPISAVGASAELMVKWKVGTHGGTYGGGNAVVAAASCATIDTSQSEDLCGNAARMGAYLLESKSNSREAYDRGRCTWIGIDGGCRVHSCR